MQRCYERDLPLPEYAPLYQTIQVDESKRVWLERWHMPRDTTRRVWDLVDTTGAWLGAVRIPANLTIFRIGRDSLLGRSLDSLGVERVELYGLRPR